MLESVTNSQREIQMKRLYLTGSIALFVLGCAAEPTSREQQKITWGQADTLNLYPNTAALMALRSATE